MTSLNALAQDQISRLHRDCIEDPNAIDAVFLEARVRGKRLHAGVSRAAASRLCTIDRISGDHLVVRAEDFSPINGRHYYFTLSLDGHEYFFGAKLLSWAQDRLTFARPDALYRVERREAPRCQPGALGIDRNAVLHLRSRTRARVRDISRGGIGIELDGPPIEKLPASFEVELRRSPGGNSRLFAEVRSVRRTNGSVAQLGLSVSEVPSASQLIYEHRDAIDDKRGWHRFSMAGQVASTGVDRVWRRLRPTRSVSRPQVVSFENQLHQPLVGLINSAGPTEGAPAVVIPPAWGKTKETLLPLAMVIAESCDRAGLPVTILRFDGSNRRGESYIDPDCRAPGEEYRRFRFSQAVEDLRAGIQFLEKDPRFRSTRFVVVSFSLSAIEARRAVAEIGPARIAGWIPVVGMVDLQSGLKAVSGGVDYAEGILKGVTFGRHELVGVLADMDFTGRDAIEANLVFKEDARRDMARISVPVTWIHGQHDGWISVDRVREVLSAGEATNRRLIEVPTGHQLRSSSEAIRTFELIASETIRMAWGREVPAESPPLRSIDRMRDAESRRRRQESASELRAFWEDYLLGRDRAVGMDLFTATTAYRELMQLQIEALHLHAGSKVLDLGAGTGGFLRELAVAGTKPGAVLALDLVEGALRQLRLKERGYPVGAAQVNLDALSSLPCSDASVDCALASLLLSYLKDPLAVLKELRRVVRPGGRCVLSSLRRDADISSIYTEGVAELVASGAERLIVAQGASFAELQRSFLNEAARLLDLEERGLFRFYDPVELASLARRAGLKVRSTHLSLGAPPQAVVVVAERP